MPNPATPLHSVRFIYRFVYLSLLILGGILLASLLRMVFGRDWMRKTPGKAIVQAWMRLTANSLGLKMHIEGSVQKQEPMLLAANHISWLDIIVLGSLFQASFVSKDEVRQWPLIGHLAALSGTCFLKRRSVSSLRRNIAKLQGILSQGHSIAIFPEGTTSDGSSVLPFHAGLFKAAIVAGVPVQPVMLFYRRRGNRDTIAPFIGSTTFLEHIVNLMWVSETQVMVRITECVPLGEGGAGLAGHCRDLIQRQHRLLLEHDHSG